MTTTAFIDYLKENGAQLNETGDAVTSFGPAQTELLAARDTCVVIPLFHLGLLQFSGDDAKSYLHNQLTSDVNHLALSQTQHSSWCTAKGRMLANFILSHQSTGYTMLLARELIAPLQKRFQMYVLRSKVRIENLSEQCVALALCGQSAHASLSAANLPIPDAKLSIATSANGLSVINLGDARYIVLCPQESLTQTWSTLAKTATPAGIEAWKWLEVKAGIPLIDASTTEAFVPQMINFDQLGGVSFNKGCYPGQEVVARAKYLGKIKRHLYRFESSALIKVGTALLKEANAQACGTVAACAQTPTGGFTGLAVVLEEGETAPEKLETAEATPITISQFSAVVYE